MISNRGNPPPRGVPASCTAAIDKRRGVSRLVSRLQRSAPRGSGVLHASGAALGCARGRIMTEVVDAHHHLWRYSPAEYDWIDDSMQTLRRDFLPEDLEIEAAK